MQLLGLFTGQRLRRFVAFMGVILLIEPVFSCPVCMPLPQQTLADRSIAADVVVFAREDPDKPFTYRMREVLKGQLADPHIELFADSTTRRMLNVDESRRVILIRLAGEKRWQSLGIADSEFQKIIRRILVFSSEWTGKHGEQKRIEYFLTLWGHENRSVFHLAYLELGRAPYAAIKQFASSISEDELLPLMSDRNYYEWRPLAILILSQQETKQARNLITESFEACEKFSTSQNLAAWATAYIELHGEVAVDLIEEKYLRRESRTRQEIQAVLTALSVHGRLEDPKMRNRIVKSYGNALQYHPQEAALIARDLSVWKQHQYFEKFVRILDNADIELEVVEEMLIRRYIASERRELP